MFRVLEICTANIASAVAAQMAGATRIELCSELAAGGVTPSVGVIEQVRSRIDIAINVLIRPRSGDFLYSSDEVESVLRDIAWCSKLGVQGVVVGALTPDAKVDVDASRQWLKEARSRGLSATFHRAIDCAENIFDATEVIALGSYTKGQFVRLFLGSDNTATPSKPIASAKQLSLHVSLTLESATTKDTDGDWEIQEPTAISYDISTTALVRSNETITSEVAAQTLADVESIHEAGTPVKWQIANVSGANQRTKGAIICSGSAVLTNLTLNGPNRQSADYNAQLTGYGEYTVAA